MSTKITNIYEQLVLLIQAALPDHKRLWDIEELESNPDPLLTRGWGLKIGAARNTNRNICPNYSLARTFSFALSRSIVAKASDPEKRELEKLQILEDLHLVLEQAYERLSLEGYAVGIAYEDDAGPQEVTLGDKPFAILDAQFTVEYIQQVSGG